MSSDRHTKGRTDGRTDGRYQLHYLPRFAVDNKEILDVQNRKHEWQEKNIYYGSFCQRSSIKCQSGFQCIACCLQY